jgi:uncharacterized membrane protein
MENLQQLIDEYNKLYAQQEAQTHLFMMELYLSLLVVPLALISIYFFRNKIRIAYNKVWFFFHKNHRLMAKKENDVVFEGIVLGIFIVISVFAFGVFVVHSETKEGFSEMLLLNPNGAVGNYMESSLVNQTVKYNMVIENHEGKPMLYELKVILENNQTGTNSTLLTFYNVLPNGGQWKFPINFTVTEPGYYKLIFSLHYYDNSTFKPSGIFTQSFLKVS